MNARDFIGLLLLAALWSISFIFMRVAVPDLGPFALVLLRVGLAALSLGLLLLAQGKLPVLRAYWRPIAVVGILNAAIPFTLFAWASQTLSAGFLSAFNGVTPICGAVIAWAWLKEHLSPSRALGLALGFVGVLVLGWGRLRVGLAEADDTLVLLAVVLAAVAGYGFYGLAACYTKRYLTGVNGLACTAGGMLSATLAALPLAAYSWPQVPVPAISWLAVVALGLLCTGGGYLLFFRLIASIGPQRALTATFLVPPLGVSWGWLLLGEIPTMSMLVGMLITLAGTALATGVVGERSPKAAANTVESPPP